MVHLLNNLVALSLFAYRNFCQQVVARRQLELRRCFARLYGLLALFSNACPSVGLLSDTHVLFYGWLYNNVIVFFFIDHVSLVCSPITKGRFFQFHLGLE